MSAHKNKNKIINLMPQEEFASSTLGRILAWLLSSFRTIVIVTEMIVMGAFLSRFWLDARNTDLNDEIKQKQTVVASYSDFEKEFRATQRKLTIISSLILNPKEASPLFEQIGSLAPGDTQLTSINIVGNEVSIRGQSVSEVSIGQYLANLQATALFKELNLGQLSFDERTTYLNFTLTGTLEDKKNGS